MVCLKQDYHFRGENLFKKIGYGLVVVLIILFGINHFKTTPVKSKLTIGIVAHNRPYSYYKNKQLTGFEVELAKKIATQMKAQPHFKVVDEQATLNKMVKNHEVDIAFGAFNQTNLKSKKLTSLPYLYPQNTLFVTNKSKVKDVSDLTSKTVGCLKKDNKKQLLQGINPNIKIKVYSDKKQLFKAVLQHKISAGIVSDYQYTSFLAKNIKVSPHYATTLKSQNTKAAQKLTTLRKVGDINVTNDQIVALINPAKKKEIDKTLTELHNSNQIIDLSQKYFKQDLTKQ